MNYSNRKPPSPGLSMEERMRLLDEKRKNPGPPPPVDCKALEKIYNTNFRPEVYQQAVNGKCPGFVQQPKGGKKSRKRKTKKTKQGRKSRKSRRYKK
jgi:hypothetical protein